MKLHRIYAVVLRNVYTFTRNYDRWLDAFYWPIMNLVIWGLTSVYLTQISSTLSGVVLVIVSGLTFWLLVDRAQYETNVALLEEMWSRNLINIFVSPLKLSEWIIGVIIVGIIKASASFVVAAITAFILYETNVFMYGFYLLPFIFLLLMTGWWISFFIISAILRFGTKVQTFAWTLATILSPFSGIYYPVSALPEWAQKISYLLPTTYVFEGIRSIIYTQTFDSQKMIIAFFLNIIFCILGIWYLQRSFNKIINRGMLQIT